MFTGIPDQRKNAWGMFLGLKYALDQIDGDLKLVNVGDIPEFLLEILKRSMARANLAEGQVKFTGYISDEKLNALYHSGLVLLFPNLYEGFGFPVI
ncbi:MAG: glycosyltransferase [Deltaproteobacteria bacterium]|nr:glycosyltransferase [Deltaproteobacteria bacterium]